MRGQYVVRPRAFLTEPQGDFVKVFRDFWWIVDENGDPIFYDYPGEYPLPMGNGHPGVAERLITQTGGARIVNLPLAFQTIDPNNF